MPTFSDAFANLTNWTNTVGTAAVAAGKLQGTTQGDVGANLVGNGESWTGGPPPTGWIQATSIATTVDTIAEGIGPSGGADNQVVKVVKTGGNGLIYQVLTTLVGAYYNCSLRGYAPSSNTDPNACSIFWTGSFPVNITSEDAWETLSSTVMATTDSYGPALRATSMTVGDTAYFDAVTAHRQNTIVLLNAGLWTNTDGTITVDLPQPAAPSVVPLGILFRYTDALNYWELRMKPNTAGTDTEIVEVVAGVETVRASADVDWSTDGSTDQVRIVLLGNTVHIWRNRNGEGWAEVCSYLLMTTGLASVRMGIMLYDTGLGRVSLFEAYYVAPVAIVTQTPSLSCYIDVATPQGVRIAQMDAFLALNYARTVNDFGVMTLDLDPDTDRSLFRLDGRLGIWRQPTGGGLGLEFDTIWLVRNTKRVLKSNGERRLRITAVSALELLSRRIIAYAAGSAQALKTATDADNLLKDFVDENMGASATDTDRHWHDLITIAADESLGTHVDKACARRNLLTVCQEVADQSQQLGYPLYFDVVCPTYGALEFRTWINQRGADRRASSANPLILSPELGSISEAEYEENYLDEATYVYAGGDGLETLREIATASDTARIGSSPFGRREYFRDARQGATGASLTAEASAALYERRPRRLFSGSLTDTDQVRYGRDWRWGDRVTVQFEGESFDCEISAVKVQVADGRETVQAALRAEEII